jgi:hypothetical protein
MPRFYKGVGLGTYLHGTDLRLNGLSARMPRSDKLSGTGAVSVNLAATGSTTHDLVASLNGSGPHEFH